MKDFKQNETMVAVAVVLPLNSPTPNFQALITFVDKAKRLKKT